jgi:hypothetical protein
LHCCCSFYRSSSCYCFCYCFCTVCVTQQAVGEISPTACCVTHTDCRICCIIVRKFSTTRTWLFCFCNLKISFAPLDRFGQHGVGIYQLMITIKRILEITCSGNPVPGWRSYASSDPVGSLRMSPELSGTDESIHCVTSRRHREPAEQQLTDWVQDAPGKHGRRAQSSARSRWGSPNQGLRTCPGSTADARRKRARAGATRTTG